VSSPYEFLRWILLLSRLGEERKRIADFRLQVADWGRHRAWSIEKYSRQRKEERGSTVGAVFFDLSDST
jgi:hypothetical protein